MPLGITIKRARYNRVDKKEEGFLEPQFSEQQVLIDLGLTLKQARVYIALVKFGPSRIMEIADNAKVARPDVYATLNRLQQQALVEKLIKTPPEYRAVPMKDALEKLLEARTSQYQKVKAETEILQETYNVEKADETQTESAQFVLVPEGKVVDKIGNSIEKAEKSIDVVVSWKRFSHGIADALAENIESAWAKKVKIRLIVEKPPKNRTTEQLIQYFRQKPFTQMRFVKDHPETVFGIYDRKEMSVMVISKSDLQDSPGLWSTNDALISLAKNHIEALWSEATEKT